MVRGSFDQRQSAVMVYFCSPPTAVRTLILTEAALPAAAPSISPAQLQLCSDGVDHVGLRLLHSEPVVRPEVRTTTTRILDLFIGPGYTTEI